MSKRAKSVLLECLAYLIILGLAAGAVFLSFITSQWVTLETGDPQLGRGLAIAVFFCFLVSLGIVIGVSRYLIEQRKAAQLLGRKLRRLLDED